MRVVEWTAMGRCSEVVMTSDEGKVQRKHIQMLARGKSKGRKKEGAVDGIPMREYSTAGGRAKSNLIK